MTYVDNGPAWWTLLLLAIGGGLTALLAHNGAKEFLGWWGAWRRQYRARHRADPIEDATDDTIDDATWRAANPSMHGADPIDKVIDHDLVLAYGTNGSVTPDTIMATVMRLGWAANGRYVHRADCPHMTTGKPITVWSEDAARNWAEATKPRLTACPHCEPFNASEPAEASGV